MSKCKICKDSSVTATINTLIASGVRQKVIAEQHPGFSIFQISRHKNNCLAPNVAPEIAADAGSDELRVWMQRNTDAYNLAIVNSDSRSAIAACSAATRQLIALHKKLEKEAKAAEKAVDPDSREGLKITVAGIDALLAHAAESGDIENGIAPRVLTLLNEEPSFAQIVQTIWANRSILPALLACCVTDYLPPRQTTTEEISANNHD
jgi:hypothetical protein